LKIKIDQNIITQTLVDLVRINSINPGLVPDQPGEAKIADYIAGSLKKIGLKPIFQKLRSGRKNVIAILHGSRNGKSLLLNGHMDTVGVKGMTDPFSTQIKHGKLYGRGAQDMKGGIAAMLGMMKALVETSTQLKGDIIFTAVADEEFESIGTEALVREYKTDAAIVTEPTNLDICLAHKGFTVFEIETEGKAAHGGSYDQGVDANLFMGRVLSELDKLSQRLNKTSKHSLLGPPSLHVPLVKGGSELFIYSDQCKISVERRTLPGENIDKVIKEIESILSQLSENDDKFKASFRTVVYRNSYEISPEAPIVKLVTQATTKTLGNSPNFIGHNWWEDSALLAEAGMETVILGPVGDGIHTNEEWVDIQSVVDLSKILTQVAIDFCN